MKKSIVYSNLLDLANKVSVLKDNENSTEEFSLFSVLHLMICNFSAIVSSFNEISCSLLILRRL